MFTDCIRTVLTLYSIHKEGMTLAVVFLSLLRWGRISYSERGTLLLVRTGGFSPWLRVGGHR